MSATSPGAVKIANVAERVTVTHVSVPTVSVHHPSAPAGAESAETVGNANAVKNPVVTV